MGIFDTAVEIAFDDGAADALISAADSADQTLRSEGSFLGVATGYAMEDFKGGYATLFASALAVRADDRGRLAGVLAALAEDVTQAKVKALEEKSRLKELTAWQQRADFREQHFQTFQSVASDPMPAEWPVAAPTISAVFSARARARFAGGSGGGAAQLLLIEAIPGVIGNLNGITATARNLANRKRLITEQDRINAELARTPQLLPASQGMSMTNPAWTRLQTQQKALDGITEAMRNAGGTKAVLLGFDLTHGSPKAQVSVGNPDTADNVTYAVSGMLITPQSGFNDWARNAANLQRHQQRISRGESFAVVAWINYEPPTVPTVNSGDAARTGAERFITDIHGFNAVRGGLGNRTPETLNVLAHSYGTTVTSNALAAAQLNVASFTMLGSAGIEKEIRNAGELHVPAGQVYATEAAGDGLAQMGRFQRQDPRMESFGAKVFSSEAATIDGIHYQGTTEHNTLVNDKGGSGYGYLDQDTTALHEAALTTTGNGDRILPGAQLVSPPLGFAGR